MAWTSFHMMRGRWLMNCFYLETGFVLTLVLFWGRDFFCHLGNLVVLRRKLSEVEVQADVKEEIVHSSGRCSKSKNPASLTVLPTLPPPL